MWKYIDLGTYLSNAFNLNAVSFRMFQRNIEMFRSDCIFLNNNHIDIMNYKYK